MSFMLRRCCIVGAFCGIGFSVWVSATPSGYRLRQWFSGWVARGKTLVRLADDVLSGELVVANSDGTIGHWRTRILASESRLDNLEDLVGGLDVYEIENRVTAVEQQWSRMREDWHGSERSFIRRWAEIHTQSTADRAQVSEIREFATHTRQVALRVSDFCEQLDGRVVTAFSGLGDLAGRVALLEARGTD